MPSCARVFSKVVSWNSLWYGGVFVDRILHAISGYSEGWGGVKQNAYARPKGRDCRSLAFLHFSPCTSGQTPDYYRASIVVIIHTSSSHTTLFRRESWNRVTFSARILGVPRCVGRAKRENADVCILDVTVGRPAKRRKKHVTKRWKMRWIARASW